MGWITSQFINRHSKRRLPVQIPVAQVEHLEPRQCPAAPQLAAADVDLLLDRAAVATAREDSIFAVVDRNGRILGVRVEADALAVLDPTPLDSSDDGTLVFAIDGAVAKARTAAFFANDTAPLTSRLIRFISQSTITQREVESNPNVDNASAATANASTARGPGFVAPIGLGGHFPPGIAFTPPVDLFAIEHTNRDSNRNPGADGVKNMADDVALRTFPDPVDGSVRGRFNIDPAFVPVGQGLFAPESYGATQNSGLLPHAQSRGIGTLPGGVPLFRDTNHDGIGDTLVGGIGVFFPGSDGYATHEQGFVAGVGQTAEQRTNASRVLEAEYIALAAAGGSTIAANMGIAGAKIGTINGVAAVPGLDIPFGRIDLVGITLQIFGPIAGRLGLQQLLQAGTEIGVGDPTSVGFAQPLMDDQPLLPNPMMDRFDGFHRTGLPVPEGWLVTPHDSQVDLELDAADVTAIIEEGIRAADATRAAIRLPLGSHTEMVFAVTDTTGEVLGLYRMPDATVFSIDVAVAKARNVAYYSDPDPDVLQPLDQIVDRGVAFTNRTFRFLAEPRYPAGIDGTRPGDFSTLNNPDINPHTAENNRTAENKSVPITAGSFTSVLGYDAFHPMTNFRDPGDSSVVVGKDSAGNEVFAPTANQNGIVFFPGSTPIYKNGELIGCFGVSGDGVDQDDVVTAIATGSQYQPPSTVTRADQVIFRGVRLPFFKFLRNPFGLGSDDD